jgi:hydroxymethylpyrimidine/phosphomethylpyrimidine kinase
MTALYELAHSYRDAAEKLADLDLPPEVIEDTLESLSGDLEVKATNTAMLVRNIEATAEKIKEAEAAMAVTTC